MSFIVLFAVLILSLSAHTDRVYDAYVGMKAPVFAVADSTTSVSLENLRGRYVVVSFWSSTDAQSRLAAKSYDKLAGQIAKVPRSEERLCFLSVNFDRSERLFREIMRRDNFTAKTHFYVSGSTADALVSNYRLDSGYRSYLIDPTGKMVDVNPSPTRLREIAES